MKYNKLWIFTILCSFLLLSACGKEKENVETDKPSQEDLDPGKQYATEYVEPSEEEKFKDRYILDLTGKEVQYDLANNLSKKFYLNGTVELCNYYNYGYTNEKAYFCGQLTPVDGGYSDSWYLYFRRDTFKDAYQKLLNGDVNMRISAFIPSESYMRGQGNMAIVNEMETYWLKRGIIPSFLLNLKIILSLFVCTSFFRSMSYNENYIDIIRSVKINN